MDVKLLPKGTNIFDNCKLKVLPIRKLFNWYVLGHFLVGCAWQHGSAQIVGSYFFPFESNQEARNAYYMKNYPDWFGSVGKSLIKKPDGTFMVVDDVDLQKLKDQNKLGLEYATTMGGRVTDLTQKPILVLKAE